MKTRATSLLLPAVLVLVVVGLAVWVVSQLTGAQAAAERLPTIVVGLSASESSWGSEAQPGAGSVVGSTSSTPAATDVMTGRSVGSDVSDGSRTTTDTLGGATTTATSKPGEDTSPHTSASPGTAPPGTRMVVPDPLREHVREHDAGSMSTTGTIATGTTTSTTVSTTSTTVTTTSGSTSGMMGTTGTTGH
ncbi:MAG: hypothetical protein ACYC33_07595 [Thermoleophilia bacterium]